MADKKEEINKSQEISENAPISEEKGNGPSSNTEDLTEKLKALEDQYLRLLADYQNLQKRTAQEKQELYKFASQKTIELLLPALDTFDYARTQLNPETGVEKIIKDFELVFDSLLKTLKEIGLATIEETGIPFDPFFHEPLHQIPTNELPNHTVMQILKKGYMLNKKVIRPALVAVSVSPMKEEKDKPSSEDEKPLGEG